MTPIYVMYIPYNPHNCYRVAHFMVCMCVIYVMSGGTLIHVGKGEL